MEGFGRSRDDRKMGQGFVDVKKKTIPELKELVERQDALLKNRAFIAKLADKGEKIINFRNQLEEELARRDVVEATDLISGLSIHCAEDIEWHDNAVGEKKETLDSDDDSDCEVDPLKLIATHSGTIQHSRKLKQLPEPEGLIKEHLLDAPHVVSLCDKYGDVKEREMKFEMNKPRTKEDVVEWYAKTGEKVKKCLGGNWEVTAATPPPPVHGKAQMISLSDSLKLQKEQAALLKEIERKNAGERLSRHMGVKMGSSLPTHNILNYRSGTNLGGRFEGSVRREELKEEETEERGGAVFYNIIDDVGDS